MTRQEDGPAVSVVTVTLNSADTLADTLRSVAGQTHRDLEHVIIDGGSTDGTLAMIRAAAADDPRVVWRSGPDRGIYDAMNKGIALARGGLIGMLNSDDVFADDFALADLVGHVHATGAEAVYADLVFVDPVDLARVRRVWSAGRGRIAYGWSPPHPALYVGAEVYRRIGGYRTDLTISADYDLMLRLFDPRRPIRIAYLPRILVRMRTGGRSTRGPHSHLVGFREAQRSLRDAGARHPGLTNALRVLRKLRQLRRSRVSIG